MNIEKYLFIFLAAVIFSCGSQDSKNTSQNIDPQQTARTDSIRNEVLGKNVFDVRFSNEYGDLETLDGTNNTTWVTYYPKVDITLVSDKKTELIKEAYSGKVPKSR